MGPLNSFVSSILYWAEIACMAIRCLLQELRGEEPDCPVCWKCDMMRVLVLCFLAASFTTLLKFLL